MNDGLDSLLGEIRENLFLKIGKICLKEDRVIIFYTKMGVRYYANLHFFLLFLAAFFTTVFVSVLGSFFGEVSKFFKSVSDKARDLKKS